MPIPTPLRMFLLDRETDWPAELPHKRDMNLKLPAIEKLVFLAQERGLFMPNQSNDDCAHKIIRAIRELKTLKAEQTHKEQADKTEPAKINPYEPIVQVPQNKDKVLNHAAPGVFHYAQGGKKPEAKTAKDENAKPRPENQQGKN